MAHGSQIVRAKENKFSHGDLVNDKHQLAN